MHFESEFLKPLRQDPEEFLRLWRVLEYENHIVRVSDQFCLTYYVSGFDILEPLVNYVMQVDISETLAEKVQWCRRQRIFQKSAA